MTTELEFHYYFDPLCGWCYASAPGLAAVAKHHGDRLRMKPTGLFVAPRPVAEIADHARRNDQRIAEISGQPFSEAYHEGVMRAPDGIFTSGPLTLAFIAMDELDPTLKPQFLHAAQIARYVEGRDTSRAQISADVAAAFAASAGHSIDAAALTRRLEQDTDLHRKAEKRMIEAQSEMAALGIRGVPQLVVSQDGNERIIDSADLYAGGEALLDSIFNSESTLASQVL